MPSNLEIFPSQSQSFFLSGPAGQLQCHIDYPQPLRDAAMRQGIVIVCHPHPLHGGTMTNKVVTTVARSFNHLGLPSIRFNYRGVGESAGSYGDTIGEAEDLRAILTWIQTHRPDYPIYLAGFSFGTVVVSRVAMNPVIKQLLLIAPPVNHYDFTSLPKPVCPRFVVIGEVDEVVPCKEVEAWVEVAKPQPKLITVEETSHFFHSKLITLKDIIVTHYQPLIVEL
ncbi:MAG: alpha/beta fold hydrolase [Pseudomonadota bacterium]